MRTGRYSIAAVLICLSLVSRAQAQTTYAWNYSGTDWASSSNWSPTGTPTAADTALFSTFDGITYNLPTFNSSAAVGQLDIFGPRWGFDTPFVGNGNTLTVGTGGTISVAPFVYRGSFATTVILNNLRVNVANGTTFASGYAQTVGAVELSGFASRFDLRSGSELRLVNAAGTANYDLTINGGAQLRVNSGTILTNGVGVNTAGQGAIRFHGGGTLNFQGADATAGGSVTTEFTANQVVAASGHSSVGIFAGSDFSGTNTANVRVILGNSSIQRGIDVNTRDTAGNFLSLGTGTVEFAFNGIVPGFSGSNAELIFRPGATGIPMINGVIVENVSSNSNSPYVILTGGVKDANGSELEGVTGRFATWNSTTGAVTAQAGVYRNETELSSVTAGQNVIYRPSTTTATATLSASINPQTIVFEARANNQSVNLGGNTLTTPGIIVERTITGSGTFNFNLTNGTLATPDGSPLKLYVLGPSNTLFNVGANFSNSNGSVVKSGTGTLVLTGNTPQMNNVLDIYINQGAIRARIDGANANLGTTNVLNLRGGVLEVDANGGTSTFTRGLGRNFNQVNWNFGTSTMISDRGSGGFAVVNGNLDVNIGNGQNLVWNAASGTSLSFLRSGQSLRLGSLQQTGILTLQNNLSLDDGSAGLPLESRQIVVESLSSGGFGNPARRSRITGVISGSASTGLMKIGPGMLELTGANTYAGGTTIDLGTLLVNNTTGSATGTGRVTVYDTLIGNGAIAPSAGNGLTMMSSSILGLYRDQILGTPGHLKVGTAGADNPVTLRAGSNSIFQLNGSTFNTDGGATSYGRLTVRGTGLITVNGAGLVVALGPGFTPGGSDAFGIIDNQTSSAISGTFNGIAEGGTVNAVFINNAPAGTFLLTYQGNITESGISITGGNDVVLYGFSPVPEPGAVLAIGAAGLGVLGWVRRRLVPCR